MQDIRRITGFRGRIDDHDIVGVVNEIGFQEEDSFAVTGDVQPRSLRGRLQRRGQNRNRRQILSDRPHGERQQDQQGAQSFHFFSDEFVAERLIHV